MLRRCREVWVFRRQTTVILKLRAPQTVRRSFELPGEEGKRRTEKKAWEEDSETLSPDFSHCSSAFNCFIVYSSSYHMVSLSYKIKIELTNTVQRIVSYLVPLQESTTPLIRTLISVDMALFWRTKNPNIKNSL